MKEKQKISYKYSTVYSRGYFLIPRIVEANPDLSITDCWIYSKILNYTQNEKVIGLWWTIDWFVKEILKGKVSAATYKRSINNLIKANLLTREIRKGTTTELFINELLEPDPDQNEPGQKETGQIDPRVAQIELTPDQNELGVAQIDPQYNTIQSNTELNNTKQLNTEMGLEKKDAKADKNTLQKPHIADPPSEKERPPSTIGIKVLPSERQYLQGKLTMERYAQIGVEIECVREHCKKITGNSSSARQVRSNYLYWAADYSEDEIKQAISNQKYHEFWGEGGKAEGRLDLIKLTRRKGSNQEPLDWIGELLSVKRPEPIRSAISGVLRRGKTMAEKIAERKRMEQQANISLSI